MMGQPRGAIARFDRMAIRFAYSSAERPDGRRLCGADRRVLKLHGAEQWLTAPA